MIPGIFNFLTTCGAMSSLDVDIRATASSSYDRIHISKVLKLPSW